MPQQKQQIPKGKFLKNLIYHGSQLDTINEAVGLAQVTGRGSMLSSALTKSRRNRCAQRKGFGVFLHVRQERAENPMIRHIFSQYEFGQTIPDHNILILFLYVSVTSTQNHHEMIIFRHAPCVSLWFPGTQAFLPWWPPRWAPVASPCRICSVPWRLWCRIHQDPTTATQTFIVTNIDRLE